MWSSSSRAVSFALQGGTVTPRRRNSSTMLRMAVLCRGRRFAIMFAARIRTSCCSLVASRLILRSTSSEVQSTQTRYDHVSKYYVRCSKYIHNPISTKSSLSSAHHARSPSALVGLEIEANENVVASPLTKKILLVHWHRCDFPKRKTTSLW